MTENQKSLRRLADARIFDLMKLITIEKEYEGSLCYNGESKREWVGEIKGIITMCMYADILDLTDFMKILNTVNKL